MTAITAIGSSITINRAAPQLPRSLRRALADAGIIPSGPAEVVGGGCIARSWRIDSNAGPLLVKYLTDTPDDFFAAEAAGLAALATTATVATPPVRAVGSEFICLDYLAPSPWMPESWTQLGHDLARLHALPQSAFGFVTDTYCGSSRQPNGQTNDGHVFFAEQRLLYQGAMALGQHRLDNTEMRWLERLCQRLPELVPKQPPALIHGDLWSGNLLCHQGQPTLIDPACYTGWAEAELAMTTLFGAFDEHFYAAYEATAAIDTRWRQRCDIYNLYHLLNHLNLFGGGYHAEVHQVLRRYR